MLTATTCSSANFTTNWTKLWEKKKRKKWRTMFNALEMRGGRRGMCNCLMQVIWRSCLPTSSPPPLPSYTAEFPIKIVSNKFGVVFLKNSSRQVLFIIINRIPQSCRFWYKKERGFKRNQTRKSESNEKIERIGTKYSPGLALHAQAPWESWTARVFCYRLGSDFVGKAGCGFHYRSSSFISAANLLASHAFLRPEQCLPFTIISLYDAISSPQNDHNFSENVCRIR